MWVLVIGFDCGCFRWVCLFAGLCDCWFGGWVFGYGLVFVCFGDLWLVILVWFAGIVVLCVNSVVLNFYLFYVVFWF